MRSLQVYYTDSDGMLQMQLQGHGEVTSAIQTLLNKIAKCLLTSTGSNQFTGKGTVLGDKSALARLGDNIDHIRLLVHDAVSSVEQIILAEQLSTPPNTIDASVLESLVVSDILRDPNDPTNIFVEVLVKTQVNTTYYLTV